MSRYGLIHRQSVTELLLDGLTWRLEQDDPRQQPTSYLSYYDNTVLQELTKPAHLVDALIPFDEDIAAFPATTGTSAPEISNYSNTVLQETQQSPLLSADSPVAPEAARQPSVDLQNYDNTVIQKKSLPSDQADQVRCVRRS
jgi:hypothetical protein